MTTGQQVAYLVPDTSYHKYGRIIAKTATIGSKGRYLVNFDDRTNGIYDESELIPITFHPPTDGPQIAENNP